MKARAELVLASLFLLGACAGGGGEGPAAAQSCACSLPQQPTYPDVTTFALYWSLGGVGTDVTIDRSANTLAGSSGGTVSGQIAGSASGITTLSLNVTGVARASRFTETFQAADLATSTPIPGQAPRTLLSGNEDRERRIGTDAHCPRYGDR